MGFWGPKSKTFRGWEEKLSLPHHTGDAGPNGRAARGHRYFDVEGSVETRRGGDAHANGG